MTAADRAQKVQAFGRCRPPIAVQGIRPYPGGVAFAFHSVVTPRTLRALGVVLVVLGVSSCKDAPAPPKLGEVPAFQLRDQQGVSVTRDTVSDGPWALAFIFTRCPTVCPRITQAMKRLQVSAREQGVKLKLVSVSVDPEHDSPEVLRGFAARFGADTSTWRFLTGDPKVVQGLAEGVKIAVEGAPDGSAEHFGITHGSHLVLVDRTGTIRGYYRTSDEQELVRILDDAVRVDEDSSR